MSAATGNRLAVIGGTGIEELEGLVVCREHALETPFGSPSCAIQEGHLGDATVLFLHRHGSPSTIPPHLINYRANLWALQALGARDVVAINAVGGIGEAMLPGRLVIPDQLVDYTWGREHTFDDGSSGSLQHIDFTEPYDSELRGALISAAERGGLKCETGGVLGVTQGPRLETAAEVQRMARDGCDLVGMTGMPEAALARELGLAYVSVCMVVNAAAGLGDQPLSLSSMQAILQREIAVVRSLLVALVGMRYST